MAQPTRCLRLRPLTRPSTPLQFSSTYSPRLQPTITRTGAFSTTPSQAYPRDRNPNRGVSFLRRSGLREPVSVSKYPLPKPVLDPRLRDMPKTDEDHPLWGFFNAKKDRLSPSTLERRHGRSWSLAELRQKSWDDLHMLWWVCLKELNRLHTGVEELARLNDRPGRAELNERIDTVKRTQKFIKWTLTERHYAWQDARRLAESDESVDTTAESGAYSPSLDTSGPFMRESNKDVVIGHERENTRT